MRKIVSLLVICVILFTACSEKNVFKNSGTNPNSSATAAPTSTPAIQPSPTSTPGTQPSPTAAPVTQPSAVPAVKVSDYFPFTKNVHMKYKGTGNEYAGYDTYVDYIRDDVMQVRNINGGTDVAVVYKLKDGAVQKVFTKEEAYYKYDYTSLSNWKEIIIKEPIKEGTSWTLGDGSSRSITAVDKQLKTPAGNYKALEVTTKGKDSTERNYYVKNIGLVKSEFKSNNNSLTITSELEKIENGVPFKQYVTFYFPQFSKDRVVYLDRNIEIYTNEDMKFKFQKELKTVPENSGLSKVLSTNTRVLGCNIDEEKGTVTVNFSTELVKEMNAGTSLEMMLLKSITNTFGNYYQKNKVIITIEGKPYSSGHVLMEQGAFFSVDRENTAEYKNP